MTHTVGSASHTRTGVEGNTCSWASKEAGLRIYAQLLSIIRTGRGAWLEAQTHCSLIPAFPVSLVPAYLTCILEELWDGFLTHMHINICPYCYPHISKSMQAYILGYLWC
jgi:hypothetical protein